MERRKFLGSATALVGATLSAQALGALGGLDKLGGALGGGEKDTGAASWKDVAKSFGEARTTFAETAQKQALVAADIADALDLKSEAETLRGEAANLADKGDAMGSGDLDAVSENSASTQALIEAKLRESEALTDEQKAALGKAAADYMPTLITGVSVAIQVKDTVENASDLGAPGFRDGRAAVSAAKDIPVLGPKMIKFLVDSAKTGTALISLMKTRGVATPDDSEIETQLAGFA